MVLIICRMITASVAAAAVIIEFLLLWASPAIAGGRSWLRSAATLDGTEETNERSRRRS